MRIRTILSVVSVWAMLSSCLGSAAEKESAPIVHMGMIQSLFRGSETGMLLAQSSPMGDMLLSQSDLKGEVTVVSEPEELVRQVQKGDLQIAVIHGIEYAWVRDKYPEVKPLVLAVNKEVQLKACILVREDNSAKNIADLHGKAFAFPPRSLNHVYLYLHRAIQDAGFNPTGFFAPSDAPANVNQALDAVVDGTVEGTIVDAVAWDVYCQRKPGRAKKLHVIQESGCFPTATVVYNAKTSDPKIMEKVRAALLASDQTALGRQMLTLWRLTQFRDVPNNYDALLVDIAKTYPTVFKPAPFVASAPKAASADAR